jgi:hypothetical protein
MENHKTIARNEICGRRQRTKNERAKPAARGLFFVGHKATGRNIEGQKNEQQPNDRVLYFCPPNFSAKCPFFSSSSLPGFNAPLSGSRGWRAFFVFARKRNRVEFMIFRFRRYSNLDRRLRQIDEIINSSGKIQRDIFKRFLLMENAAMNRHDAKKNRSGCNEHDAGN